jgi:hypothetical protein
MADEPRDAVTSVRLSPELHAGLKLAGQQYGLTISDVLRVVAERVGEMSAEEFERLLACPTCGGSGRRRLGRADG